METSGPIVFKSGPEFGATLARRKFEAKGCLLMFVLSEKKFKTGQDVVETGLYVSDCCNDEVMLDKDASFPRCRQCSGLSNWELVDSPAEEQAA